MADETAPWEQYSGTAVETPPWEQYSSEKPEQPASSGYVGRGEFAPEAAQAPIVTSQPQDPLAQIAKGVMDTFGQFVPKSIPELVKMMTFPRVSDVAEQQKETEALGQAWRGEHGLEAQAGAIAGSVLQALPLAHLAGSIVPESPLRTTPLEPNPPPTEIRGPGTTATDVSKALERRFELVPEPKPEIAAAPTTEEALAKAQPRENVNIETGQPFTPERDVRTGVASETAAISETPATAAEVAKTQGEENASQITSTEGALAPEVRGRVGEEAPLRQQGETAPARQEIQPEGQAVATLPQVEQPATMEGGGLRPEEEPRPAETQAVVEQPRQQPAAPEQPASVAPETAPATRAAHGEIAGGEAGTSNRVMEEVHGAGEVPGGRGADTTALVEGARSDLASGKVDPYDIISRTGKTGQATDPEYAALAVEHERLVNQAVELQKAARTPEQTQIANEAAQQAKDFANSLQPYKTAASNRMRQFQGDLNYDVSTPFGMEQYMEQELNRPPTLKERTQFERLSKEIRNVEDKLPDAIERADRKVRAKYAKVEDISMEEAVSRVKANLKDCLV